MELPLRAVSLDLDNTLWDTPPVLARAEQVLRDWLVVHCPGLARRFDAAALARLRLEVASAQPERAHDLSFVRREALRRAARASGYADAAAAQAFAVFLGARNEIVPFDEVPVALERLAARLPVYALSNGNACVWRVGLGRHFRAAIDAAAAGAAKPDPRMYARLLEVAGVPAGAVLHVGDDAEADVEGARQAGLRTAWMNRGGATWPAALPPPDHEIGDLDELVRIVERLLEPR
ncbi:MAG TPA: HAD family hydrolase [Steroidobacteraceae bacterium]|nr:HAD family hydrolase [Steroidobacteraceae bacterium]